MNKALLKLYLDMSCTMELNKGVSNTYVINSNIPTGHGDIEFKKHLYVKNVGSHKAYNIKTYLYGNTTQECEITSSKEELKPNESDVIVISKKYHKGETSNNVLSVGVEYDNIP